MEKLNKNVVALSLGITSGILYIICLVIVAIIPITTMTPFVNALQHSIDFTGMMTRSINFVGSIVGIIGWFLIATATGWIFASVYNWLADKF